MSIVSVNNWNKLLFQIQRYADSLEKSKENEYSICKELNQITRFDTMICRLGKSKEYEYSICKQLKQVTLFDTMTCRLEKSKEYE